MLGNKEAVATIAVKDLAAARKFYEGTLGLKVLNAQGSEAVTYQSGASKVIVYRSQFAGTNRSTVANWLVGPEIEAIVQGLADRGVPFEHYDLPGLTRQGHLHVVGTDQAGAPATFKTAWFKDPDGNIISLMNI